MDLLARLKNADPLAAEAAAEIVALRGRLAAAEELADAAGQLLAVLPGVHGEAAALRSALERFRPPGGEPVAWTGESKLAFLKTFSGLAPLTQLRFIEFARRFMAGDELAEQLADRVQRGEMTRDELLATMLAGVDPADA